MKQRTNSTRLIFLAQLTPNQSNHKSSASLTLVTHVLLINSVYLSRVFGSGFLSHQGSLTEVTMEQGNTDNSVVEVASSELMGDIREVDRVEVFQRINVTMDMKTNVPEPFNAEISEEMIKEGVPVGLSDSQVRKYSV